MMERLSSQAEAVEGHRQRAQDFVVRQRLKGGGSSCGRPTATEEISSSYTAARRNGIKFTTAILRGEASPPSVLARLRG